MATGTHQERKGTNPEWQGIRSVDMLGFSTAYGLTRMDSMLDRNTNEDSFSHKRQTKQKTEEQLNKKIPNNAQIVRITMKSPVRNKRNASYTYGEKLDDNLTLCGKTALLKTDDRSSRGRKSAASRGTNSSLPSIHRTDASSVASASSVNVTPYYDTDFGFHFERLGPTAGMSLHKDPPHDTRDLNEELANTAQKHIYSLQIVSTHHRGCKRKESVHSLMNTLWPSRSRSRTRKNDDKSAKPPSSGQGSTRGYTADLPPRSGQRLLKRTTSPDKQSKRIEAKLSRAPTNQFGNNSFHLAAGVSPRSIKLESRSSFLPDIEAVINGNNIQPKYKTK